MMLDSVDENLEYKKFKLFLVGLGSSLIVIGVGFLLYFITVLYGLVQTSDQAALVQYMQGYFPVDGDQIVIQGSIGSDEIDINMSSSVGLFFSLILFIFAVGVTSVIGKTFIYAGVKLIVAVTGPQNFIKNKAKLFGENEENKPYDERP